MASVSDKTVVLKARVGSGDSAINVEWCESKLCWTVSSEHINSGWWFTVSNKPPADSILDTGYEYALQLANELESMVQRHVRLARDSSAAAEKVQEFVNLQREQNATDKVPST